jgi:haloalkane dehalogenase
VIANTWCWRPTLPFRLFAAALGGPIGRYFIIQHNLFAARLLPLAVVSAQRATPALLRTYTDPFPTPASRTGTYVFPWAVRHSDARLDAIEARLPRLRDRPVELLMGTRDPIHGTEAAIRRWRQHFPDAPIDRVPTAGHYLQEDAPERLSAAVRRLLGRLTL